jgi:cell division protein FtsB
MPPARATTAASRRYSSRSRPHQAARPPLRIRWERVGRVVLVIVLTVLFGLYLQQGLTFLSDHSQASQQREIVRQLARQRAALLRQRRALADPATIERKARGLGMIKPGERPYVITGFPGG